ncbi:MAG: hypothetical protein A2041_11575 [Bacteroidetes bacterium GWA2_31_9b]|nr:MAG: hypothetical protein A2041_11575 [Bacteroidetes bacterium GWA2_31_9b]
MKKIFLLFILPLFLISACEEDEISESEQLKIDIKLIEKYLEENSLTAQSTESGLHYIIIEQGAGETATLESIVDVNYTGMLLDGTIFDSTRNSLVLEELIKGWQEGIPLIQKGGSIKLFIPSKLGYGDTAKDNIPKNSVLIFDIELLNVIPL